MYKCGSKVIHMSKNIDTVKIFELKQKINQLLEEKPELVPYQLKIEELLSKLKTPEQRLLVLMQLISRRANSMLKRTESLLKTTK